MPELGSRVKNSGSSGRGLWSIGPSSNFSTSLSWWSRCSEYEADITAGGSEKPEERSTLVDSSSASSCLRDEREAINLEGPGAQGTAVTLD